jgi:predicted ArsR family transcriptional regulator
MSSGTIDIDEFEAADADEFEERNDTERIVLFLDEHDDRAWKAATIAERLGLDTDAVSAILSRLKERGLVRMRNGSEQPTGFTAITRLQTSSTARSSSMR